MKSKSFLKEILIFLGVGLLINLFCFFIYFFPVHAEETINPLPYYVNYYYSDYFHLTSEQLDLITSYTGQSDYNIFWLGEPSESNTSWTFNLYCFEIGESGSSVDLKSGSDLSTNVDFGMFDMDNDYVVISKSTGSFVKRVIRIKKDTGEWSFLQTTMPTVRSASLLHLSTKEINQFGFTPNVPFIFQSTDPLIWQGDSTQIIFANGAPIPPTPEEDNITDNVDKPSWNDYTVDFSTGKPSWDSTEPMMSLYSLWSWFVGKLGDALTGGWNFIVDSFDWALQIFLNNVRQKFNEVKQAVNDFAYLVEDSVEYINGFLSDIKDSFDYLIEPIDHTAINSALTNSDFYQLISIGITTKNIFVNYFSSIPQPSSLSFSVPYTILTHSGYINIDFSWYDNIRSTIVPWVVGFLYAGFGLFVFRSIPSIIHGVSGILQKGG